MHLINHYTEFILNVNPLISYSVLFLISFLDTLIIIGAFFPASFFVMMAGFFSFHSDINILLSGLFIIIGGLSGDLLSYFIGTKGINWFKNEKRILKASYLEKGERFFNKYGEKSIILGRFLGVVKSVIPFVAGLVKMNFKRFIFLNTIASVIWTIVHLGIGYILGKSLTVFYIPKDVKFAVLFLPFIFFFLWTIFEYKFNIFGLFKINKTKDN